MSENMIACFPTLQKVVEKQRLLTQRATLVALNVWRTADDDVLYADRLSYVQPDERHE